MLYFACRFLIAVKDEALGRSSVTCESEDGGHSIYHPMKLYFVAIFQASHFLEDGTAAQRKGIMTK